MEGRDVEVLNLSKRDFARVVALLGNPPTPNGKRQAAIKARPEAPKRRWLRTTLPSPKRSRQGVFPVAGGGEGDETTSWSPLPEGEGAPVV